MLGVTNVTTVWGNIEKLNGVGIASSTVDVVSLVNLSEAIMRSSVPGEEAARVLRPHGKLLVVGWDPKANLGPSAQTQVAATDVETRIHAAGFKTLETFQAGRYHWGILFEK